MAVNAGSISHRALRVSCATSEYPYQGMQHFQDMIYKEAAESKQSYLIFYNIDKNTFLRDFKESNRHFFKDYFPQFKILLTKMPVRAHNEAYHRMNKIIITQVTAMGLDNDLQLLGDSDVTTPQRTKRPDLSYLPEQLPAGRSYQWPSVVVESAYSDAQRELASDARWWLYASGGDVQTVLTISVWKESKGITFETWELISRPTRGNPGKMVPEVVQKAVVSKESDEPVRISGAPFVIGFENLFLRPAEEEKGEGHVIIGEDDLAMVAEHVWMRD